MSTSRQVLNLWRLDRPQQAFTMLKELGDGDVPVPRDVFIYLLQSLTKHKDLSSSRCLHLHIISNGLEPDAFLADHLIRMFAFCGLLEESMQVFYKMPHVSTYSWNAVIQAHARLGEQLMSIQLYHFMRENCLVPDKCTFCCILKACGSIGHLDQGMLIHESIINAGFDSDVPVGCAALDMYGKCGNLAAALKVFSMLPSRDAVAWGAIINLYADYGSLVETLELYERMQCENIEVNQFFFPCLVKACIKVRAVAQGNLLYDVILRNRLETDNVISNVLLDMYANFGYLDDAYKVFHISQCKSIPSWGAMISGYSSQGHFPSALELFGEMQQLGIKPSQPLLVSVLKSCSGLGCIGRGNIIFFQIVDNGFESDVVIASSLIDMYSKCGSIEDAEKVFKEVKCLDIAVWGSIICAYSQHGNGYKTLCLVDKLQHDGFVPDAGVLLSTIQGVASIGNVNQGRIVHRNAISCGYIPSRLFASALIDMYSKCGSLNEAENIFSGLEKPDTTSWGAMIGGYIQHGHEITALELFKSMHNEDAEVDEVIYALVLKACAEIGTLEEGKLIHYQLLISGYERDITVSGSIIKMYASLGSLDEALKLLHQLSRYHGTTVPWAAVILGCVNHGDNLLALELFEFMQEKGIRPDRPLYLAVTRACANVGCMSESMMIHDRIARNEMDEVDKMIANALVDMYMKCGGYWEAFKVFSRIQNPDHVSWSTLVRGYSMCGDFSVGKRILEYMQHHSINPDEIMYNILLSACGHVGLLEDGCLQFGDMFVRHKMWPSVDHHNCMVDLLSRMGRLKEAEDMMETVPTTPVMTGWTSLITNCRTYGDIKLGRASFERCTKLTTYNL